MQRRLRQLVVTLWVGSLWTTGYVVAPTLFATLADRGLAGTIAGSLFRVEAWLSLGCSVTLLMLCFTPEARALPEHPTIVRLILGVAACTLIGHFCLQPLMAEIRAVGVPVGGMAPALKMRFGALHGVSRGFYLIPSRLGVALLLMLGADQSAKSAAIPSPRRI
ncbi:MAG: DUF4149 domain-containing protein [Burkholderiaceae bacterium]